MAINREASVARTAHDKQHVNRLVVPEFGVIELRVRVSDAKGSKSYLTPDAEPARAPGGKGTDDFHFAPGPQLDAGTWAVDPAKNDDVEIWYDLFNPFLALESAKLELFRRFDKTPFWTRDLKDDELDEGEHILKFGPKAKWDGKIDAHADFPTEFLTVEHSPYKLKLSVKGKGVCNSHTAWTYFHILIAKIELEYGPKDVLPATVAGSADHRKVYDAVIAQGANPPGAGTTIKVPLESNIFKKGHSMFDNSLFTEYETMWGKGRAYPDFCEGLDQELRRCGCASAEGFGKSQVPVGLGEQAGAHGGSLRQSGSGLRKEHRRSRKVRTVTRNEEASAAKAVTPCFQSRLVTRRSPR